MKRLFIIVVVTLFTGCEAVFVEDISGGAIEILAPLENTSVTAGNITFFWESLDSAESYKVQIATPSFESASQILLDSTLTDLTIEKDLVSGNYQWRVKALNSEYETSYSTASFIVN
jgi:type III secretory pathway lipoprotein EscJ